MFTSSFRFFLLSAIFTSITLKNISAVHKNMSDIIKVCSLQLPFTEIKPRSRFNFSLASFQLEHKQHTSLLETLSRDVHSIVHTHTHLLEDLAALTGGMYPSLLSAQGELEGEQEEKHLFLSYYGIRHG